MGRKAKYSKEVKIKACMDYEKGDVSFNDISKSIGAAKAVINRWYLTYKEHGPKAFEVSNKERLYSKQFKLSIIEEYTIDKCSQADIAAKHNLTTGLVSNWVNKWYNSIEIKGFDSKGDVYTMKSRKTSFEERLEIANWVINNDMNYKAAADKYLVSYALVYKWTRAYLNEGEDALKTKKRGPKARSEVNENNLTEMEKLKLELDKERALRKRRELELEILKKKEEFEKKLYSQKLDKNPNTKQ